LENGFILSGLQPGLRLMSLFKPSYCPFFQKIFITPNYTMTSYIGPLTEGIIDTCITEFKKPAIREKITKNIIDPVVREISIKLLPYFATLLILQIAIVGLIIYILTSS
jgi:hypothetical protein